MDKYRFDIIRKYVLVECKPFDPDDVPKTKMSTLPIKIKKLISELTEEEYKPNFDDGDGFFTDFLNGEIQFYLLKFDNRIFFVDTQGYNYARYVGELIP